jgi:hypothetical protein
VCGSDRLAVEPALKFHVVVAGNGKGDAALDHAEDDAKDVGRTGTTVNVIADKNDAAGVCARRRDAPVRTFAVHVYDVAKPAQQLHELASAAVHVSDNVERTRLSPQIRASKGVFALNLLHHLRVHIRGPDGNRVS